MSATSCRRDLRVRGRRPRVHQKFGNGNVVVVDGSKLTVAFDKAGEKTVVDSFVRRV